MLRNRLYYALKPMMPLTARRAIRGWFARRKRDQVTGVWPILPGSENPPEGWPGWPDGKKFALVLTHDVEGQAGYDKIEKVMDLEERLGFRSSFNLIPEGQYRSTPEFRAHIRSRGFEVGIHDLHHDGKLFLSQSEFRRNAPRINEYLKDWDAAGFRSGFMLRNLDWIHDLHVQYDLSTFDTDPFEPQPHGVNTIFPFWVPRPGTRNQESGIRNQGSGDSGQDPSSIIHHPSSNAPSRSSRSSVDNSEVPGPSSSNTLAFSLQPLALTNNSGQAAPSSAFRPPSSGPDPSSVFRPPSSGYVELPYTLPQDSTLFLILGERHPDIWFQKLDWIAKHGGMTLLNVHPDYIQFDSNDSAPRTYSVELYARFLEYVKTRYAGQFWHALPSQVAELTLRHPSPQPRPPRRICMLTHSFYMSDARVTRYAEALADRGDHVEVLALKRAPEQPREEVVKGVHLTRVQPRYGKTESTRLSYLWPVLRFLLASSVIVARRHARNPYDLLHVHNLPDFIVFAALYPKLKGAKVILDIHDIVPEFYASKFGVHKHTNVIRSLKSIEKLCAHFADHVIISNHLWRDTYASRTGANGKCSVFINNVDTAIFQPRPRTRQDDKLIIIFPGGLQWHQGLDIAIRAFQKVRAQFPNAEFHIYGYGNMKPQLLKLTAELGLKEPVKFFDPLPVRQVAEIMANADLGVVPKRADSFGNEAYSTKIMEFMSLGVPVVVSKTKIDEYYFNDSVIRFFESGNADQLADEILKLARNPELRQALARRASAYAELHSWDRRKSAYLGLVDALLSGAPVVVPPDPLDQSVSSDKHQTRALERPVERVGK